jgi:hypothetical protein
MMNMLSLLSPTSWKWILAGLVAIAVAGVIYAGYSFVTDLQDELTRITIDNATLVANEAVFEQAIEDQKETFVSLQRDFELQGSVLTTVSNEFQVSRDRVRALEDRLSDHELGFLAANRPGIVERIINSATDEVGRCFEIASGSPLTPDEFNAKLPSEINSECPDIANPNFRVIQ